MPIPLDSGWDSTRPIYRQLRERMVALMLDGALREGEALPSVRQLAAAWQLSPLTVLKGYQQLAGEHWIEKRRGRGLFVRSGAAAALREAERQRFLEREWPKVRATIERLGLAIEPLLQAPASRAGTEP